MTRVDDRTRASPSRARARPRARPDGAKGELCTILLRSPRTRVAPALTRALPPSRNRVFTGRHLRLYRQYRDRAHRARQAPHPDPGCQPQGAPPQLRTKRRTEKPRLPALSNRLRPRDRAIARATRGAERNARATREKNTSRVLVPIPVRRARPRPPPPRDREGRRRRFGCAPAKRRRRRLSVSAARGRRFRASHLAVARQIFGDLSCERASLEKVFSRFRKKFFH